MSITNPSCSRRYWKKSRANCYTRTDHFFLLTFMRCGWRLRYFWWLRYLRWEENFPLKLFVLQIAASITVPRVRITDIWVKVELRFVSPKRKGVRWKKSFIFWCISGRFESPCLAIFRYQAFFLQAHSKVVSVQLPPLWHGKGILFLLYRRTFKFIMGKTFLHNKAR